MSCLVEWDAQDRIAGLLAYGWRWGSPDLPYMPASTLKTDGKSAVAKRNGRA